MQNNGSNGLSYVLITAARDEAAFIRETLEAVVVQTVCPLRWVIVSDGSTDGTDEIVKEFAARWHWIEFMRLPDRAERHFGGKVNAFNAGYARVKHLAFDVIGNLDGDSSFEPGYLEYLLEKFAHNPRLGVAGTDYVEERWDSPLSQNRFSNIEDVTGQCQLFRRECFEAIGGYKPSKLGGVDLIANLEARMRGWETRVFTDKVLLHHRPQGRAQANRFSVELVNGRKDYLFGSHPLWATCRAAYRLARKPYVVGGTLLLAGYYWAMLTGSRKTVAKNVVKFRRNEQKRRLARIFRGMLLPRNSRFQRMLGSGLKGLLYIPRVCRICVNWPCYLRNYFLRRKVPAEYSMRSGVRLVDGTGTLTGTMAVVFVRQEYGPLDGFGTIVDIGAHVGSFAVYAAQSNPAARIVCFEPERQNFSQLKRNIQINGLRGRISAFRYAVASDKGRRELAVRKSLLNSFHIVSGDAGHQTVNCTTLRDILATHALESIDLLKLNCEGAEYEILESCSPAEFARIANIRLEYHDLDDSTRNGEALCRFLEVRGYRIERFTRRYCSTSGFIWAARTGVIEPGQLSGAVGPRGSLAAAEVMAGCGVEILIGIL